MNQMQSKLILFIYGVAVLWRLWGMKKKLSLPKLRGEGWFFSLQVGPRFYQEEGKEIYFMYRVWLWAPLVAELIFAVPVIYSGRVVYYAILVFGGCALSIAGHIALARKYIKKVKALKGITCPPPARSIALSLQPRELRAYSSTPIEYGFAFAMVASLASLAILARRDPGDWREIIFLPLLALYLQAGVLLVKKALVRWRLALPVEGADQYHALREETRRYFLRICDWFRGVCVFLMVFWAVRAWVTNEETEWMVWCVSIVLYLGIWMGFLVKISRDVSRLLALAKQVEPVDLSHSSRKRVEDGRFSLGGFVYYNPDNPSLLVRGTRWRSVNLANQRFYGYLAYLAGFVLLMFWLR